MTWFRDRRDAGQQLLALLRTYDLSDPIVLGIPRGGVTVAAEVAAGLNAELGVVVARKLGAPTQPELAIGAVTASGVAFVDWALAALTGADEAYVEQERAAQAAEARRREARFNSQRRPPLRDREVILVDDGVATGATAIAAIRTIKAEGAAKVIFAVPVGPAHTIQHLRQEADEVLCLHEEHDFHAVGQYYDDFQAVEDAEVEALLQIGQP